MFISYTRLVRRFRSLPRRFTVFCRSRRRLRSFAFYPSHQLRSQGLFRFQNGEPGVKTAGTKLPKYSKNRRVFCCIKHDVLSSFKKWFQIARKQTRLPIAEKNLRKCNLLLFHRVSRDNNLVQGVSKLGTPF